MRISAKFGGWLLLLLVGVLICASVYPAMAESQAIKPLQEWRGRTDNANAGLAPARGYFANQGELAKLWAAWRIPGPCPRVDFKTHMVLVRTCPCSHISVAPLVNGQGNLQVQVTMTKDLREDTGYVLVLIPRQGIRTMEGKPLEVD